MEVIKLDDFPSNPEQDAVYEIIPDKARIVSSTNRLFNKYPTRFISAVPRFAIMNYSIPRDTVLDPFCGSGTTAIEALLLQRNALSADIDPFARLLIKVKTTIYTKEDIQIINDIVEKIRISSPQPIEQYQLPEIPNIEKWFCEASICGLSNIKQIVDENTTNNEVVKNYFYVVIAGIIRKVSNADEVSPKPYISTRYPKTPAEVLPLFLKVESLYRDAIIEFSDKVKLNGCTSLILDSNDARSINYTGSVDLAVTSPPYINAYDYVRSLRFEDLWLGLISEDELRNNRKTYIGTESSSAFYDEYVYATQSESLIPLVEKIRKIDHKRAEIVNTYFEDMALNICSIGKCLKSGGRYVIVVGDSKIRNQDIPTAKILCEISEKNGFLFDLSFKYIIRDRYLHLPRGNRGGIIKYDEILILKKR